jgi:hypothetical protein
MGDIPDRVFRVDVPLTVITLARQRIEILRAPDRPDLTVTEVSALRDLAGDVPPAATWARLRVRCRGARDGARQNQWLPPLPPPSASAEDRADAVEAPAYSASKVALNASTVLLLAKQTEDTSADQRGLTRQGPHPDAARRPPRPDRAATGIVDIALLPTMGGPERSPEMDTAPIGE